MSWLPDLRPRMMPHHVPLWPFPLTTDKRHDPIYVQVPGAVLEVHAADLLDPEVQNCTLYVGAKVADTNRGLELVFPEQTVLPVTCRKSISNLAHLVLIELPEGGHLVWEWEQVDELLRRRFAYLESLDETTPPSVAERAF